jgi:chromosome condensin MukBEF complex kleisin-like MukF subunit
MPQTFFYTFRTNKFIDEIEDALGQEVYIIDKYSKDFAKLVEGIKLSGASNLCGIGISKYYTRFEEYTFNKIGKNKIVIDGLEKIKLSIPESKVFNTDTRMTFGPCNYVVYRLGTETDLENYFLHIMPKDLSKLKTLEL